ncbi:MAG: virulence RhuM family protein [Streptococcaceae bacterium]|nr:virulence RhuM family protein [Streptococcaceae bacterium]MCL2681509.1 virulence RhuM family protein [Streptococcaceae bacterium]
MDEIVIYNTEDGLSKVELRLNEGTAWLSQNEIAELFQTSKNNVSLHVKNILDDKELDKISTVKDSLTVQKEGNREVSRSITYYNLDMILAIGYRVRSTRGIQFRRYATTVLKEYLEKGFVMDDERLKNLGGGDYFKELLDRIRDIRSSEKVFYRQVLDLFATSSDYNSKAKEASEFFATVQNKMHFAIHQHTASELVVNRIDSDKDFLGLQTFKGELPTLNEAKVAKNYLNEEELKGLNQLVSGYLDFAERQANRQTVMTMKDWVIHVNNILQATGEKILENAGSISTQEKDEKVESEYKKYKQKTLSQVEKDYLQEIKNIDGLAKKENK